MRQRTAAATRWSRFETKIAISAAMGAGSELGFTKRKQTWRRAPEIRP